jgi:Undecaprenyl-phosphate glucose phosphotransferase
MLQPGSEAFGRESGRTALPEGARAVAQGLRRASVSPTLVGGIAAVLDAVALALGIWFGGYASAGADFDALRTGGIAVGLALGLATLAWVLGDYRLRTLRRFGRSVARLLGLALATAMLAGVDPLATVLVAASVLLSRGLGSALAGSALDFGLTERRAVIVGGGERALTVMTALVAAGADIRVCGIFDDRDDSRSPPVVRGVPKLGTLVDLVAFVRAAEIDMLIVTLPLGADRRIREVLKAVEVLPVDVRLSDFSDDPAFRRRGASPARGGLIGVMSRPLRQRQRLVKRGLDLAGAAAAVLLLSPVLLVTALAIRIETPGPVLFRQPRHGYNHRPIEVWKFRSMYVGDCDPTARHIVTRNDPRVTTVGRLIRRFSIDELPQLFNVLVGDLSLVGPRPHALDAVSSRQESFEAIVDRYAARHKVRPGITGWAQINGWRGAIDDPDALRRRVEHDLFYIENWSLWLDLRVLALTPFRLLDTRNAY